MGNWLWGPKAEVPETSQGVTVQDGVYNKPQLSGVNVGGNIYMNVSTNVQAPASTETNVSPTVRDPALNRESRPQNGSPEDKLLSIRKEFVKRVSEPVLNQLLDQLYQQKIIDQEEMGTARRCNTKAEMARAVIDMARDKGPDASSSLIDGLVSLDPTVSKTLGLI